MRAVILSDWGGPEQVSLGELKKPQAGTGEVLVEVRAAGVNPVDWKVREGQARDFFEFHLPQAMGGELSGVIVGLGDGVDDFQVGDEVHGAIGPMGAFAEFAAVKADSLARKPDNLSFEEAAALPNAAVTAVAALDAGAVGEGTRVLIHAAAGGVGSIAVQLAKVRGAEVTGMASPDHKDFVASLGVDHVIDRTTAYDNFLRDYDMVLDAYGPEAQARTWKALKPGGIMVSLVSPPSEETAGKHGVRATMVVANPEGRILADVDRHVAAGEIHPRVTRTYPLERALEAIAEVEAGNVCGKVVLTVP